MVFGFIFSIIGLYSGYIISVWISIQIVHFILKQDIEFRYQSPCFYDPVQFSIYRSCHIISSMYYNNHYLKWFCICFLFTIYKHKL